MWKNKVYKNLSMFSFHELLFTLLLAYTAARVQAKELTEEGNETDNSLKSESEGKDLTLDRYYSHIPDEFIYGHCALQPNPGTTDLKQLVWGNVYLRQSLKGGTTELRIEASGFDSDDDDVDHGFHVHEYGDLSQGCQSAGQHYDPFRTVHGGPKDSPHYRHFGDLGNVKEDSDGNVEAHIKDYLVSLLGPFSVLGRAIVIHSRQDDLGRGKTEESLLTGSAGDRLACCTIGLSDGKQWQ